jgi:hypothetical protein
MKCRITNLDDFGVSSSGVTSAYSKQQALQTFLYNLAGVPASSVPDFVGGIKAFWILQHRRGYSPFVNRIEFQTTFTGT